MFYKRNYLSDRKIHKNVLNEVVKTLEIPHMLAFIFGLQKIKISTENEYVTFVSPSYKIFHLLVLLIITPLMMASIPNVLDNTFFEINLFLKISISAAYTFLIILYNAMVINSLFFAPKSYKNVLQLIIEINQKFSKLGCSRSTHVKKSLIVLFILQTTAKIFNLIITFSGIMTWSLYLFPICSTVVDLELIFLIGYIGAASRSFEILNRKIASIANIDCDIQSGIIMKLWSTENENIEAFFNDNSIETCLSIYNNLLEFLNQVHQCFGLTVFMSFCSC